MLIMTLKLSTLCRNIYPLTHGEMNELSYILLSMEEKTYLIEMNELSYNPAKEHDCIQMQHLSIKKHDCIQIQLNPIHY